MVNWLFQVWCNWGLDAFSVAWLYEELFTLSLKSGVGDYSEKYIAYLNDLAIRVFYRFILFAQNLRVGNSQILSERITPFSTFFMWNGLALHCEFFSFYHLDSQMYECEAEGSGLVSAQGNFVRRGGLCPLPGKIQSQAGWGFEQPSLMGGTLLMAGRLHWQYFKTDHL